MRHTHTYGCLKEENGRLNFACGHPVGPEVAELTRAFNEGDHDAFDALKQKVEKRMAEALNARADFLTTEGAK